MFTALILACTAAGAVSAKACGNIDLAASVYRRMHDFAERSDNPALLALARMHWALQLMHLSARARATALLIHGIDELSASVDFTGQDTLAAEMVGMLHLQQAQTAGRAGDADATEVHLSEADMLANRLGERNGLNRHFGPTNVALWRLGSGSSCRTVPKLTNGGYTLSRRFQCWAARNVRHR